MLKDYFKLSSKEMIELLYICLTLGVLFSLTFMRFASSGESFFQVFIVFFTFILVMLSLRLLFMKYIAYKNGFEIHMKMTYFDRYWFHNYDRISYTMDGKVGPVNTPTKILGIPMTIFSIIIYIFSLGLIIFPSMWRYDIKTIRHRFIGTKHKHEHTFSQTEEVTTYRFSKVLFSGFLFYLFFSFFLKVIAEDINLSYYYWFIFIIFYTAFFSLIPIMGTEGFEFWHKGRFGWLCSITILFLGFLSLLVFDDMLFVLIATIISIMIVSIIILWKELM